jgi:hypothetical protein
MQKISIPELISRVTTFFKSQNTEPGAHQNTPLSNNAKESLAFIWSGLGSKHHIEWFSSLHNQGRAHMLLLLQIPPYTL